MGSGIDNFVTNAFVLGTFISRVPDFINFISDLADGTFFTFARSASLGDLITRTGFAGDWIFVIVLSSVSDDVGTGASAGWIGWSSNWWASTGFINTFTVVAAFDLNWLLGKLVVTVAGWALFEVKSVAEDLGKTGSWANFWTFFNLLVINAFEFSAAISAVPNVVDVFLRVVW